MFLEKLNMETFPNISGLYSDFFRNLRIDARFSEHSTKAEPHWSPRPRWMTEYPYTLYPVSSVSGSLQTNHATVTSVINIITEQRHTKKDFEKLQLAIRDNNLNFHQLHNDVSHRLWNFIQSINTSTNRQDCWYIARSEICQW